MYKSEWVEFPEFFLLNIQVRDCSFTSGLHHHIHKALFHGPPTRVIFDQIKDLFYYSLVFQTKIAIIITATVHAHSPAYVKAFGGYY